MENRPTTMNGPLHTPEANLDDRHMLATFGTLDEARAAQQRLVDAGIPKERTGVRVHATESGEIGAVQHSADGGLVGTIRHAIVPDDNTRMLRDAAAHDEAVLDVCPEAGEADRIVGIIQACHPRHFDPELERWRNG